MKRMLPLLLALALLLSACSARTQTVYPTIELTTEPTETTQAAADEPQSTTVDGDFSLAYLPAYGLNPYECTATVNRALFSLLYESLFVVSNHYRAEPVLCESFKVSNEGTAYTFTLVSGVTFSDGTPLTAEDVAASIEAARTSPLYRSRLSHLSYYLVNEDGTFSVFLDTPYENFALMLDIPIVKADTVKSATPTGTGAYCLRGSTLKKNPHWKQTVSPIVTADSIPLASCADPQELRDSFELGSTDLVYCDPNSAAAVGYRCDYEVWEAPTTVMHYLGFNLYSGYFVNDRLRSAVTLALDREDISNKVYGGFAQASVLPCSPNSDLYDAQLAEDYDYAPAAFSTAVTDSGVTTSTDYVGHVGRLLVCSEDPKRVAAAEYIADVLQQAGLNIVVNAVDRETYESDLRKGDFDLYYGEVRLTANFDLSEFFKEYGNLQYGSIASGGLAALCTAALENSGSYVELCSQLMQLAPICPVVFKSYALYVSRGTITSITPAVDCVFHNAGTARTLADADRTYADVTPVEPPSESTGEADETASSDTPPDESSETP